ncbi:armadillo repeat-containing protein 6 [Senna tora]|uniref:Armadillo repeat-containing protein 6 n=1 Tax=Senna tora TaxID=362788 RepID=A0A834XC98_9FABA|nr:armadillo repeat-containing protein 6 [Senna tora]
MGPPKATTRTISQEAFDEVVKENMDDLGMDPTEALQDAIQTLTLQGVDLSGIITCVPGESDVKDNPVIQCLDRLKQMDSGLGGQIDDKNLDEMVDLFDKLTEVCSVEGSGNAAIATKNGGVELICSVCSKIPSGCGRALVSALKTMASLLHDVQSTGTFQKSDGPRMIIGILNDNKQNLDILNSGFGVVASAATGNEILKESFMGLKVDELIMEIMSMHKKVNIQSLYDAIRVLLTPDDNRVVASQVYGYARKFAKIGIAGALVDSLHEGLASPGLVSASIALKAIAVNDEICKSIAEKGGIDALLRCIDDSGEHGNKTVARVCCSLLSKLAGSDANKSAIVEKGGMDRLIKLSARFDDDPSVLQEIMSIISVLSLRSPDNAARAIEAGAGDLAIQAMQKFPAAQLMQRNACNMIRNLVVRNPENRTILLKNGIEKYIRKAKQNHDNCKDAATDALRDLGLDDYNM